MTQIPKVIGHRGDEIELSPKVRKDYLGFGLSWKRAKAELREDEQRREDVREKARAQRTAVAPEPTVEDGVRQWASPALLRRLKGSATE